MAGLDRRLVRASPAARAHLASAGALAVVTAGLVVAQAVLLAQVIARAAMDGASLGSLTGTLVALGAVTAARALVTAGFELAGRLGAAAVMGDLRARLARQLLVQRPGRHGGERTGELAAAAVQGVDALEPYFAGYLPQLVLTATVPPAVLGWALQLAPVTAAILAVTVPILIVFMVLIGLRANARTEVRWRSLTLLSAHFLDVVRGLPALRAFGRDLAQAERIAEVADDYRRETMGTLRIAFLSALVLELCAMIGTALVAAAVGIMLAEGHLGLEAGLTVLLLAPELYAPLRGVGQQFHAAADGTAAAGRILDVLDEPPAVPRPIVPVAAPDPARHAIELRDARFAHPDRPGDVLRGADVALRPGALTAVVGPSGSGKTTLAALVLRLAAADAGTVRCGDVDLRDVEPREWWERVAWVPQHPCLVAGSVADNIRLGAPQATDEELMAAAAAAGAHDVAEALPGGYATVIGEGGRRLSAGQAQRVALARAFLRRASLVVLDEPTAHLDRATARHVIDGLRRLEGTVLVLTHDTDLAQRADYVYALRDGRAHPAWAGVAEAAA